MGFFLKLVWVMGYYRFMGFWYEIPANQLGGLKMVWVFTGYGLSQVWVRTGSTVMYDVSIATKVAFEIPYRDLLWHHLLLQSVGRTCISESFGASHGIVYF